MAADFSESFCQRLPYKGSWRAQARLRGCTKTSLKKSLHCFRILCLRTGALTDDDRRKPTLGQQLHQGLGFGAKLSLGKGPVPLFTALGILDAGKMDMELPGPRIPQRLPDAVKDSGIIRLGADAAQRPGVEVAEVDAGGDAAVHPAEGQHLLQRAQLADLPHRLRAEGDLGKARFIQRVLRPLQGVQRFFQGSFPALPAAAAGVEDDPPAAQRPAERRALEQIVHAVQPLFLVQAGGADIVRRVDAEQNPPGCGIVSHLPGLVQPQPDSMAALVFKGIQPHFFGIGRNVQTVLIPHGREAVAGACGTEPDLPLTHRVLPPRS